jgi:release factor glutamine methyltransferase
VTIAETLESGARDLAANSSSPHLDAELLLSEVLGVPRARLRTKSAERLTDQQCRRFGELLARRRAGAPVAYLTGLREFWSLSLRVSEAVLVPRPETETLVERALAVRGNHASCTVLDLGTGSGAIALAIAHERPLWRVTATDVSHDALAVAIENARRLDLSRIRLLQGDWFLAVEGERFDIIVSNPPYVAADDPALAALAQEPALALTPGPSGMESLARVVSGAAAHLSPGGVLLLEHGMTQGEAVRRLLQEHGFVEIVTHQDLSGRPRVTQGTFHPQH